VKPKAYLKVKYKKWDKSGIFFKIHRLKIIKLIKINMISLSLKICNKLMILIIKLLNKFWKKKTITKSKQAAESLIWKKLISNKYIQKNKLIQCNLYQAIRTYHRTIQININSINMFNRNSVSKQTTNLNIYNFYCKMEWL